MGTCYKYASPGLMIVAGSNDDISYVPSPHDRSLLSRLHLQLHDLILDLTRRNVKVSQLILELFDLHIELLPGFAQCGRSIIKELNALQNIFRLQPRSPGRDRVRPADGYRSGLWTRPGKGLGGIT